MKNARVGGLAAGLLLIGSLGLRLSAADPPYTYGGGSGDPEDPYLIATAQQMNAIGTIPADWNKHFRLTADIDMSGYSGTQYKIIGNVTIPFSGSFDGDGHTIVNLTYSTAGSASYVGVFGRTSNAIIKNLGVIGVNLSTGGSSVGGLVGEHSGAISNCYVIGPVSGVSLVGGLVGKNTGEINASWAESNVTGSADYTGGLVGSSSGTLFDSYAVGTVTGKAHSGGLVGLNSGMVQTCYAAGAVTGTYRIGGLCGRNEAGTIRDCYAAGAVTGGAYSSVGGLIGSNSGEVRRCRAAGNVSSDYYDVGGLIGYNIGKLYDGFAAGTVSGTYRVGGLIGRNNSFDGNIGEVWRCYSVGAVTGGAGMSSVGGLVGLNLATLSGCFWDTQTCGQSKGIGDGDPAGAAGKTTAEMQIQTTFTDAGWDFVGESINGTDDFWEMPPPPGYPLLAWPEPDSLALYIPGIAGSGTAADPYLISTPEEWNAVGACSRDWSRNFRLTADIDMSAFTGTQYHIPGNAFASFCGHLDGQDYAIHDLTYAAAEAKNDVGLLGRILGAFIRDLDVVDANLSTAGDCVGILAGSNAGILMNCRTTGTVSGSSFVGGLAGKNLGKIQDCSSSAAVASAAECAGGLIGFNNGPVIAGYAEGSVSGGSSVGGLIGENRTAIQNAAALGSVTASSINAGGLIGANSAALSNASAAGSVTSSSDSAGGLIGSNSAALVNCRALGDVSGASRVGGLVGNNTGPLANGFASGTVTATADSAGGLVGSNSALIRNSSAIGPVSGASEVGGLIGTNSGTVSYCHAIGETAGTANSIGGLIGKNTSAAVNISFASGAVSGVSFIGGLVGTNTGGAMNHCYASGAVTGTAESAGGLIGINTGPLTRCFAVGTVSGEAKTGGLVGDHSTGAIANCCATGDVTGTSGSTGGLIGKTTIAALSGCFSRGAVTGTTLVGGLIGEKYSGTANTCYAICPVTASGASVGGLVGKNTAGTVSCCYAESMIAAPSSTAVGGLIGTNAAGVSVSYAVGVVSGLSSVGGLIGVNSAAVSNSYSIASASADSIIGGLIGSNTSSVSYCYAAGPVSAVTATSVGGFIGSSPVAVTKCFWDLDTSGQIKGVGSGTNTGVTGKTTAEMMDPETFLLNGWDFVIETVNGTNDYWQMADPPCYPTLDWPQPARLNTVDPTIRGSGSPGDPYQICTAAQLNTIGLCPEDWNKCFLLMNDIDLSAYTGTQFRLIGHSTHAFSGVFEGGGRTVRNFTYKTAAASDCVGLFGSARGAEIKNLILENANVSSAGINVGGLVGCNFGSVQNCAVTGSFTVNGENTVYDTIAGASSVGGLIGYNAGEVLRCGSSIVTTATASTAGGLIGYNFAALQNSYSLGKVTAPLTAGGLIGYNAFPCANGFAAGQVTGTAAAGGLIGYNASDVIQSFWDTQVSAQSAGAGFGSAAGITPKTTAELQTQTTFTDAGWDFWGESANGTEETWRICPDATSYPALNWEFATLADFTAPLGAGEEDFLLLTQSWLQTAPAAFTGADADGDAQTNLRDFARFAKYRSPGQ